MDRILENLSVIPKVLGCGLFDANGECIAHRFKPPYEPILVAEVIGQLATVEDMAMTVEGVTPLKAMVVNFAGGTLLMRRVQEVTIVALAELDANLAKIGVAFNIAMLKLSRAGADSVSSVPRQRSAAPAPAAHQSAPQRNPSRTSMSMGSLSWSDTGRGGASGGGGAPRPKRPKRAAPPDAVGVRVIKHILRVIEGLAPGHGKRVLREELGRIGEEPHTVRASQLADLIRNISMRFPAQHREEFISRALGDGR